MLFITMLIKGAKISNELTSKGKIKVIPTKEVIKSSLGFGLDSVQTNLNT